MKRRLLIALALWLLALPVLGQQFHRCTSCTRDARGRISRSVRVKREFVRRHPCPSFNVKRSTFNGHCPGYQVDHIVALACGGRDVAANLQWLSVAEHRAKTRRDAHCRR